MTTTTASSLGARSWDAAAALGGRGWAVFGVWISLAEPCARLMLRAVRAMPSTSSWTWQWLPAALIVVLFVYGEGVRVLHGRFAPSVIARAALVPQRLHGVGLLAAPLFAVSLVGAERRTLWRAWLGVAAIVAMIGAVHALPDPWRAAVDLGVALALAIGATSLLAGAIRAEAASLRSASQKLLDLISP